MYYCNTCRLYACIKHLCSLQHTFIGVHLTACQCISYTNCIPALACTQHVHRL